MFTQTYDFDISGADDVFFNYTYDPKKGFGTRRNPGLLSGFITRRVIPIQGWTRQPKIRGKITNRITIFKKGFGTINRVLRVEGILKGKTGFFQRETKNNKPWVFISTGKKIKGSWIKNFPQDTSLKTLGIDSSFKFEAVDKNIKITVPNFHRYCTPSKLVMVFPSKFKLNLLLHHHDNIRFRKRESGLSKKKIKLGGAIEISEELLKGSNQLPSDVKRFIKKKLKNKRFTNLSMKASLDELKLKNSFRFSWKLKRTGN